MKSFKRIFAGIMASLLLCAVGVTASAASIGSAKKAFGFLLAYYDEDKKDDFEAFNAVCVQVGDQRVIFSTPVTDELAKEYEFTFLSSDTEKEYSIQYSHNGDLYSAFIVSSTDNIPALSRENWRIAKKFSVIYYDPDKKDVLVADISPSSEVKDGIFGLEKVPENAFTGAPILDTDTGRFVGILLKEEDENGNSYGISNEYILRTSPDSFSDSGKTVSEKQTTESQASDTYEEQTTESQISDTSEKQTTGSQPVSSEQPGVKKKTKDEDDSYSWAGWLIAVLVGSGAGLLIRTKVMKKSGTQSNETTPGYGAMPNSGFDPGGAPNIAGEQNGVVAPNNMGTPNNMGMPDNAGAPNNMGTPNNVGMPNNMGAPAFAGTQNDAQNAPKSQGAVAQSSVPQEYRTVHHNTMMGETVPLQKFGDTTVLSKEVTEMRKRPFRIVGAGGYFDRKENCFNDRETFIGRDPRYCTLRYPMNTPGISKIHCSLTWDGHTLTITDLNSTNGTFVNGRRLQPKTPQVLQPGDRFWLAEPINTFYYR